MHALIIENQFLLATLIEVELRELGYASFEVVDTEADAIRSAAANCPDLITADHRLTEGTGVEAIRMICSERPIPVVFITAYPQEVREKLPDAVLLGKPFAPRALREAVGQAIVVSRRSSEAA